MSRLSKSFSGEPNLQANNTVDKTSKRGTRTLIIDLNNGFQAHSHDGSNWHSIEKNKPREKGDQMPLTPRSNQRMSSLWGGHHASSSSSNSSSSSSSSSAVSKK